MVLAALKTGTWSTTSVKACTPLPEALLAVMVGIRAGSSATGVPLRPFGCRESHAAGSLPVSLSVVAEPRPSWRLEAPALPTVKVVRGLVTIGGSATISVNTCVAEVVPLLAVILKGYAPRVLREKRRRSASLCRCIVREATPPATMSAWSKTRGREGGNMTGTCCPTDAKDRRCWTREDGDLHDGNVDRAAGGVVRRPSREGETVAAVVAESRRVSIRAVAGDDRYPSAVTIVPERSNRGASRSIARRRVRCPCRCCFR